MKEFSIEELKKYNGKDGQPIYVAHQGKIYDVTESKLWEGGLHMQRHHGGMQAEVSKQCRAVAGILGRNQVHCPQHFAGTSAHIGQIADGRGHDVKRSRLD